METIGLMRQRYTPVRPTLGIVNNTPGVWAQAQTSIMDSVGLDLEPQNPGPDISNGQCGPRPTPLGSGPEPQNPGPDIFNRPLDINNGQRWSRPRTSEHRNQ